MTAGDRSATRARAYEAISRKGLLFRPHPTGLDRFEITATVCYGVRSHHHTDGRMDMETAVVMTTISGRERAEALAEQLIATELAACVQIAEVFSVYRWEGEIQKGREFLLMIKGRSDLFPRLREFILAHHEYELPELIKLDIVDGNPKYLRWLQGT